MKTKIRKYAKIVLASVLSLALVLQAFNGLSFVSEAEADEVIIPTEDTVTVGDATTNGVTDSSITFTTASEYNTSGAVFELFSGYSDITSILNVLGNNNGTAFVLKFTEPIDVSNHNVMTVNAVIGGWSDNTQTMKVNVYGSGATDLATDKAIGSFETVGNFNKSVTFTLDLTKYANAEGMVQNLTFRMETASTASSWVAFGAFRLSYDVTKVPYKELAFGDWGTSEGKSDTADVYSLKGHPEVTSLDHVAISGKVNFNGSNWLRIGGTESIKHGGFWLGHHSAGLYLTSQVIGTTGTNDYFPVGATEWETLKNTEITLRLTFDKADDNSSWVVGVSVNGGESVACTFAGAAPGMYLGFDSGITVDMTQSTAVPYTELAFGDWGTSEGKSDTADIYSLKDHDEVTSLDHVAISGKVNFNGSSWLRIGGTEDVKHGGLWFGNHSAGLYMTPQGIGGSGDYFPVDATEWETLKNTEITLRVTFDKAADGSAWIVGVSVDGTDKGSYTFNGITPGMYIGIDSGITVDMTPSGSDTPELTAVTLEDFGIVYEEYTSSTYVASTTTTSLIDTSFRGQVLFNKVNASSGDYYICYAAQGNGWDGMRIAPSSDGTLRFYDPHNLSIDVTLTAPESLGSFVGTEFELGIDLWADGNDVKVVIYINGEQYNTDAYVWTNAIANNRVGNNMNFIVSATGDSIIMGEEQPLEQLPTDFMEITLNDFGFADGTYTEESKKNLAINGTATLDRKILSAKISCVDGNMQLFYGAKDSDWSGLYFLFCPNSNTILLQQGTTGPQYTFTAKEGGFDFTNGNPVNLKITTEYVDGSATDSDLKVGVFLNGVLYDNQYIIMSDFVASLSDGVSIHRADGANGSLTISTPKRMLPSNYDQKTFIDVGIGDVTDRTGGGTSEKGTYIDWDGMIFSGKAAFAANGSEIRFGADQGGWVGSQFIMSDGKLTFNHAAGTFGDLAVWDDVTLDDVFSFSIATQYVDIDGVDGENDLQLGLWVNGEMYGNRWFYIVNYTMYEGDTYAISFCMNDGTCTLMSYLPSTASGTQDNGKYYYNLAEGGYLLSTGSGVTVNGETKANGDVLAVAGDYTIIRTEGNAEYTSTVILYQTGDAHPDGKTSAADLVAIKKVIANVELTTESGLKGADVNKDNIVNADDASQMRQVLLGKNTIDTSIDVPSVSFASGDAKVMPIGGYYGAYGSLLTDDVYQKIKDSGINLVTWSIDTYNVSGETDSVISQLALAEKYDISLFIRDAALGNETYTSQELASKIANYSMYKSFKGLTIVDEPSASDGTYGSSSLLSNYVNLASSVNKYANLSGYTNLYPLASDLGDSTSYKNYLDEYCKTYSPKMLSFDDYPFNEKSSVKVTSCAQYFENLAIVRNKAIEYDIPFWTFVQAGKWYNTSSIFSSDLTQTQMKWNANMALAFGAKGIQYFPMIDPGDTSSDSNAEWTGNGLIATDGSTTEWYTYAQNINAQIAAVDDVLMSSINKGVMIDGTYAENNITDCGVTVLSSFNQVTGVTSNDTSYTEYGAVVGCFDYYGKTALYVVNYNTNGTNNVTLSFDGTYSTQTITSAGVTTASGTSLNVNLAAGEAALVVIE